VTGVRSAIPARALQAGPVPAARAAGIGSGKEITAGQQLATYTCLRSSIQYHAARHGQVFPGREYAAAARQLILAARAGTGCSVACAGAIGRGSRAARIR